jgi:hypothetical protein
MLRIYFHDVVSINASKTMVCTHIDGSLFATCNLTLTYKDGSSTTIAVFGESPENLIVEQQSAEVAK